MDDAFAVCPASKVKLLSSTIVMVFVPFNPPFKNPPGKLEELVITTLSSEVSPWSVQFTPMVASPLTVVKALLLDVYVLLSFSIKSQYQIPDASVAVMFCGNDKVIFLLAESSLIEKLRCVPPP